MEPKLDARSVDDETEGPSPSQLAKDRQPSSRVLGTIVGFLAWARRIAEQPRLRPWLLAVAVVVFLTLAFTSFRSLPDGTHVRPAVLLVLVLVATPVTLVLNALEYRIMATALGHRVGLRSALHISLVASIANFLPAPGGAAVRTAALHGRGSTVRSAISVNIVAALLWLGLTAVVAGGALLVAGEQSSRAAAAMSLGVLLVVGAVMLLGQQSLDRRSVLGQLAFVELATVLVSAARTWLALAAIGHAASFGAATAISASGVLAAMLGILPAGLGLRELLAGGLAAVVGVSSAEAIAAASVDRVAGQLGMAITAVASGIRWSDLRATTSRST